MINRILPLFASALLALPAQAQDTPEAINYIEANLVSIFYHELGHALIDILELPVFGQEEDAADTASILLIDAFYEDDAATGIARDAAFGFLDEADTTDAAPAWWDVHGPDLQRYYNLACLFYGADPDSRGALADELEIPDERLESCAEEFELAYDSWGPVMDDLSKAAPAKSIVYKGGTDTLTERLVSDEVEILNRDFSLPETLLVEVTSCDEANAFYDPEAKSITICTEFEPHLRDLFNVN